MMEKTPHALKDGCCQAGVQHDRNLRKELMKKSTGAIRETLSMMKPLLD